MNQRHLTLILGLIGLAALSRLLPHPPNVTPLAAMALLGGAVIGRRWLAIALPMVALLISDLFLGLHNTLPFVYLGFLLTVLIGMGLRQRRGGLWLVGASLSGSLLFFVISNLGVWLVGGHHYALNAAGLGETFVAALPFFRNSVLGDLLFTGVLFAAYEWLSGRGAWLLPGRGRTAAA